MSNYYYKGTSINNFFREPTSSDTSTTMSQVFTNGISTGKSNYNIERFSGSQIGYQINGTDVTNYASPVYDEYTSSTTATVPSWASAITVVVIGGGGGGGSGSNGYKRQQPLQKKNSQNGGGGGGGGAAEYKIYRGYPVSGGAAIQITVGGGGGGGAVASADGGNGGATYVNASGSRVANAEGGYAGQGGNEGSGGVAGGGRSYDTYNVLYYNQYNNNNIQGSIYGTNSNGGQNGSGNNPSNVSGGNINQPQSHYLPIGGYGNGGTGGSGSNYEDQGRKDGGGGAGGYARIYWMV
jgi:hypothetical protein